MLPALEAHFRVAWIVLQLVMIARITLAESVDGYETASVLLSTLFTRQTRDLVWFDESG
jgi:hypothetical protein